MRYLVNVTKFTEVECGSIIVDVPDDATEEEVSLTVEHLSRYRTI